MAIEEESKADTPSNNVEAELPSKKQKPKQKRNKPTLSCAQCVERKTKCDRGRPHCLACLKRQTDCQYAPVANLIEKTKRTVGPVNVRSPARPAKRRDSQSSLGPNINGNSGFPARGKLRSFSASSPQLLSNIPFSHSTASHVFGIGSEHPFANYWTCQGGLREVIGVLPSRSQSDILISKYFEAVDPVYPMIHQQQFYAEYQHFWSFPQEQRDCFDGHFIGLVFAMLAMGTQFVDLPSTTERVQTAEFYVSAAHQALSMASFMNRASIHSIQAMVLITYFLLNDRHASDAWAFAGILIRQAYAMGLNRNPDMIVPHASPSEKQQRRKLWQAVLLQDTFLTVILKLPPTATHTDVYVDDLADEEASIASAAATDTAYIRSMWTLANLVQAVICVPRSLNHPIAATQRLKAKYISDFKTVYRSLPDFFRGWDDVSLCDLAERNQRLVRQTLFLTNNYYHCLMILHGEESEEVPINVRATLEAAHNAIGSFFLLHRLFRIDSTVWWVFQHRAFIEAELMASLLKGTDDQTDPVFTRARADVVKLIEILRSDDNEPEGSRSRVEVLSSYLIDDRKSLE